MIIALIFWEYISRKPGKPMPSENHLTVRDYFNRVIGAGPRNKRALSADRTGSTGTRGFHQILSSRQRLDSTRSAAKSRGLKITDYLARPVHAKSKFKLHSLKTTVKQSIANTDIFPGHPALSESKGLPQKASAPAPSIKNGLSRLRSSGRQSVQKKAGSDERQKIESHILNAAQKYDLPVNLITSVIRAESNFDAKAVSRAGAQGLMQLMPATARELGVKNPFNIAENIDAGSRYLRKMLDSFEGNLKLALAAYNAGPDAVIKYGGKVPPFRETQQYVKRVLKFPRQIA
jgi:hypothetical protein